MELRNGIPTKFSVHRTSHLNYPTLPDCGSCGRCSHADLLSLGHHSLLPHLAVGPLHALPVVALRAVEQVLLGHLSQVVGMLVGLVSLDGAGVVLSGPVGGERLRGELRTVKKAIAG